MEKPTAKSRVARIIKCFPKAANFSVPRNSYSPGAADKRPLDHNSRPLLPPNSKQHFSGPMVSLIPAEARRRPRGGGTRGFDAAAAGSMEPTSPKVSCTGRVKCRSRRVAVCRLGSRRSSTTTTSSFAAKKKTTAVASVWAIFRGKKATKPKKELEGMTEGFEEVPGMCRMKRFSSRRGGGLSGFDWRECSGGAAVEPVESPVDREGDVSGDEDEDEEDEVEEELPGDGVVAEPRKEVNLWMRRAVAPPMPLKLT